MFGGQMLVPLAECALWWPARGALLVADLHLEKASAYARRGMMLPPYDSIETLGRLAALIDATGARALWCLGDSYHDAHGTARLASDARALLADLQGRIDWTWIVGNHDPAIVGVGGRICGEAVVDGIVLRHEALADEKRPEVSGHFHPKLRVATRGRSVARRCFVAAERKLVLPGFGALTGGLDVRDSAIRRAVGRPAAAIVPTSGRLLHFRLG